MSATENCVTHYTCSFFVIPVYQICNVDLLRQISVWSISDIHVNTSKMQPNDALRAVNWITILHPALRRKSSELIDHSEHRSEFLLEITYNVVVWIQAKTKFW